ncbi:MAG TPA: mandelate racemase/muconate lactonizing enzyme family protein [Solirubrobacterales bacterium]|jgi:o-succinylbenzoate synthase|nr:mandelate racemase/muconate lactonizing enzyme family protein [Solirubrobacterales bacterium]
MRIASVEVIPYALPFRAPYVTARGSLERREMVLLRLCSDDGITGLGEAVPLSLRGGAPLARVVGELELLGELSELDEASLLGGIGNLSAPARCAALTALLDLRGRRAACEGRAGDAAAEPVPCNATLVAGEPAAVAADALAWAAEGFSTFKLKLGVGDDLGQVRAVREAVGPRARIRIDANAAWSVEQAKRVLGALEPLGIELAEQPVATIEEAIEVAGATSIPIAADESVESRSDAALLASLGACAFAGIKLSKVGGPEEAIAIAELLPSYLSSALDGPVGIAAAAQVAQTLRLNAPEGAVELAHGLATQRLFAETVATSECALRDGMLHPPPGPGLGVEIDERALELHRLDVR